ncbi:conserved hypothetical protein [Talaromyces stipitatus ATCC 10500]|uniref:CCHC-type domain-containing protein n=1 Tax=Talaromyces stipitatus (strain ATCC 10500 / CBS 375.48 / QM 6759 / NRRL 1006) TaxID=441959 RepID=B8LU86_TALSN|nr:uncharacterized protein TSTA_060510 [Talaromyces stipitatus ATCC 10500]EED22558.1 conserved hypothetical protein [Talaromyces stipitatus ATCC 10500]
MPCVSQLPEEVLANLREDRLLSYMEEFDKADPEAIFEKTYTEEEFVKEAEENPYYLFAKVLRRQQHLLQLYEEAAAAHNEMVENLDAPGGVDTNQNQNQKEELTRLKKELKEARREAKQNTDDIVKLQEERDQYIQAFAKLHLQTSGWGDSEGGIPRSTFTPKSIKLPKGAKLSDSVDPTFESWLIDVEGTLESNADHYPNVKDRILFVKKMCEGQAAKHLMPRLRKNSSHPFMDADDMFDHLKTIFEDMTSKMKFQDFLTEFTHEAQESETDIRSWKEDLYSKLSFELQCKLTDKVDDPDLDWTGFVRKVIKTANHLEAISTVESKVRRRGMNTNSSASSNASKSIRLTPAPSAASSSSSNKDNKKGEWVDDAAHALLMKEGKCFKCRQTGHIGRDYPNNDKPAAKKSSDLKKLEKVDEASSANSNSESENDQLIGREKDSFTIPIQIAKNTHLITTQALADTGANRLAFIDTNFAILLSRFLKVRTHRLENKCAVREYNSKTATPITHAIIFMLIVDGRRQLDVPFLIVNLGKHDVILGRMWFAKHNILVDCAKKRLLWPEEVSLKDEIVTKGYMRLP